MDFKSLGNQAAQSDDMSKTKSFETELPKAGPALMRLIGYIELGRHPSSNKTFKPALQTQVIFELSTPHHLIEVDGKKVPQRFTVRANKGNTPKSGFKKLFNQMSDACGGGKQHMFQMFDAPFLSEIYHNKTGEGDNEKTYANLDKDGAYSIKAPIQVDPLDPENSRKIPVRERHHDLIGFLWEPDPDAISDEQYVEMWNSLYIEGTRTNDKGEEVSKNYIQEKIMENLEWEGSRLQSLVEEQINVDDLTTEPANLQANAGSAQLGI